MRAAGPGLALAALVLAPADARAQSPCPGGAAACVLPDGRVVVGGQTRAPSVQVDPAAEARARADAQARGDAALRLQQALARYEAWRVYLAFEARLRVEATARADARLRANALARAGAAPDRWAHVAVPTLGRAPDEPVTFPRSTLGVLPGCGAVFTSSRRALPAYAGFCVPYRLRLDATWGLGLDGSFVFERYGDATWKSVGVHPSATWSFAHGRGATSAGDAYLRLGGDLQAPLDGGRASPDAYVGTHAGVGVHVGGRTWGFGLEVRGLARGGTSTADAAAAKVRLGAELRVSLLTVAW